MSTYKDLITPITKEEVLEKLVAFLRLGGFPVASWQAFSLPRLFADVFSEYLADLGVSISNIVKGLHVKTSTSDWLDELTENQYGDKRIAAVSTLGLVTFTDTAGVGPVTKNPEEVWFSLAGKRYVNTASFTVPLNGSISKIACRAESAGASWNVPLNSVGLLVTSIPGIAVSNPDPGAGYNGTWITTQGADAEADSDLQTRNQNKWGTEGTAANEAAYDYWIPKGSAEVKRWVAIGDQPGGAVSVRLAGLSGAVSSAAVSAVRNTLLRNARGLTTYLTVESASNVTLSIVGSIFLFPDADATTVLENVAVALAALCQTIDIGGTIYRSEIIAAVMGVEGVENFVLTSPAADTTLAATEVLGPPDVAGVVVAG